jgi:hypothetical protein
MNEILSFGQSLRSQGAGDASSKLTMDGWQRKVQDEERLKGENAAQLKQPTRRGRTSPTGDET